MARERTETGSRRSRTPASEEPAKRSRQTKAQAADEKPARRSRKAETHDDAPAKRGRVASRVTIEASEESTPKRGRSKKTEDESKAAFNPYADIDDTLDAIEKHIGLSESTMDKSEVRQSTGNLVLDLILGGGITAGWYTNFGPEQSCKSTGASTMLAAAVRDQVPIISMWDYEGSSTPDYLENIFKNVGVRDSVSNIFGVRDASGKYIVPPKVRYKSEGVAEKFFDYVAKLERTLPDKKKIGDQWYYIYEGKTPDGKIHKENQKIVGSAYDVNYFRKTGNYRIPAPDGRLQAVILLDSYPAMLPEKLDVDDPNSAIGAQARMFSEQIKRVKGKLRSKRIAVIGINQLRMKPMVMYGSPEYEPCGEALRYFSDVRLKFTSRALSAAPEAKGKGQIEEEPSVTYKKGVDTYRYIHVRGHKNKLSRPYVEGWVRLWIADAKNAAQGFDPVFDTYTYLKATGQVAGKRGKMLLQFSGNEASKYIGWLDFKRLILGDKVTIKSVCDTAGMKPVKLRDKCFQQLASGKGLEMFNSHALDNSDAPTAGEDESEDDDE